MKGRLRSIPRNLDVQVVTRVLEGGDAFRQWRGGAALALAERRSRRQQRVEFLYDRDGRAVAASDGHAVKCADVHRVAGVVQAACGVAGAPALQSSKGYGVVLARPGG